MFNGVLKASMKDLYMESGSIDMTVENIENNDNSKDNARPEQKKYEVCPEKGDIVSVKIVDMTNDGDGIGKFQDRIIFVKGAIFGETVSAVVTKVKKNFLKGEIRELIHSSPFDLSSDEICPHIAEGCGGCNLGRLSYEAQQLLKSNRLKSALERIGGFNLSGNCPDVLCEDFLPSPEVEKYRNKAIFSISGKKVGFMKSKSQDVIDCPHCQIQMPEIMEASAGIREFLNEFPMDSRYINSAMIRVGDEGKVMVVITGQLDKIEHLQDLANHIYEKVDLVSLYGINQAVKQDLKKTANRRVKSNKSRCRRGTQNVSPESIKPVLLAGNPTLIKSIDGMKFEVGPAAFFQVNEDQIASLYGKAREYAAEGLGMCMDMGRADKHQKIIADLYCGVGTIGLSMADEGSYIIGVESNKEATLNANRNAVINGIVNARFFNGEAENILSDLTCDGINGYKTDTLDLVIVDPPRAGCDVRLLSTIVEMKPGTIVYVSCDPATLSRDLSILCREQEYRLMKVCPVDMFPGSMHVECIALIQRVKL